MTEITPSDMPSPLTRLAAMGSRGGPGTAPVVGAAGLMRRPDACPKADLAAEGTRSMVGRPLHVVIDAINDNALPRGPDRYLMELLRHMAARPDAPRMTLLHAPWQEFFAGLDLGPQARICAVAAPRRPLARAVWQARRFPALANAADPDVVFLPNLIWAPGIAAPVVMTAHDLLHFRTPEKFGPVKARLQRVLIRRAMGRADRIVAVSAATATDAVRFGRADVRRISVIAPGGPAAVPRMAPSGRYFLFVGKIERSKNVERLARAFLDSRLLAEGGWRLVIAGPDGNAASALAPLLARGGHRIDRRGFVAQDELDALYGGATGFVFPSEAEGFGLVLLEAMARGAPVIAARATALPEVVGPAGLLVAPGSEAELRAAMERLAQDRALGARLTAAGYARLATFSWDRAAARTLAVFQQAAREGRRNGTPRQRHAGRQRTGDLGDPSALQ